MSQHIRLMLAFLLTAIGAASSDLTANLTAAPEFTHREESAWINSPPLKLSELRGKVVLVDFWTFACWNCYRSFPWLNDLEERLASQGLQVIGVHSPELERERDRDDLVKNVKKYQLKHPIMIDNDFSYWRAMSNTAWPSFYVIDKHGIVRGTFSGEIHPQDDQARQIEKLVVALMVEE